MLMPVFLPYYNMRTLLLLVASSWLLVFRTSDCKS